MKHALDIYRVVYKQPKSCIVLLQSSDEGATRIVDIISITR